MTRRPSGPAGTSWGVRFEDQAVYEHLLGHDVHLIRMDDETSADDVNGWMNWMKPGGLVSDGTEPGTFLGGVEQVLTPDLLEGNGSETAYFHVNLKPGEYAWVSEVPDPNANGLLREFSVPSPDAEGVASPPPRPGFVVPDRGTSRNFGVVGEAEDDDLSERTANSEMDDATRAAFDHLANYDEENLE